ncbi:hypothetical protein [Candidatus Nitrosotenuis uzonensis]|uniref:Uncharacterized protein n=1 Tax=Candidatus Nitrosotenuis uzonensis TaxID=1407055 RepID=A0A812EUA3_9ARCH|nr:hypothetical protein [Candidatus Nitrosotenuis uzonensis]CAE6486867.1 hypothetical protein NUZ5A_20218 [Candidatus Nitrosotenuis uzonensis]
MQTAKVTVNNQDIKVTFDKNEKFATLVSVSSLMPSKGKTINELKKNMK